MHPARQWLDEVLAKRAVEALRHNGFEAVYAGDAAEACRLTLAMIPSGARVGFGTSMTLREIGILDMLHDGPYHLINPPWTEDSTTPEERLDLRRQALLSDAFLTGTNAVTLDGKLVNIDASGNRVSAMVFGPKKTIVVTGANKITRTAEEALDRVRHLAAPANARRLSYETPCATTGVCSDCRAQARICRATVILERRTKLLELAVVVVGESLGL